MKKKLKIGALEWEYDDYVNEKNMGDDLGSCDYEKLSIKIKRKLPEDIKKITIIHELLHGFFFFSGGNSPKNEEDIVDLLANQFVMFIQNNPNFFKKIFLNKNRKKI